MQSQKELTVAMNEQYEYCVSRVDPHYLAIEERSPNEAPPTTSSTQLNVSHELTVANVVETADRATATEVDEDTQLYRRKLQKVIRAKLIAAATRRDRNIKPIVNFIQKRDWEALKFAYGGY